MNTRQSVLGSRTVCRSKGQKHTVRRPTVLDWLGDGRLSTLHTRTVHNPDMSLSSGRAEPYRARPRSLDYPGLRPRLSTSHGAEQEQWRFQNALHQITRFAANLQPTTTKFGPRDHKAVGELLLRDHCSRLSQSTGKVDHTKNTQNKEHNLDSTRSMNS